MTQLRKRFRIQWIIPQWTHGNMAGVTHMIIPVPTPYSDDWCERNGIIDTSKCFYFTNKE
jgi:hypothetical protein